MLSAVVLNLVGVVLCCDLIVGVVDDNDGDTLPVVVVDKGDAAWPIGILLAAASSSLR